jgi:hypothetical protein
MYTGMDATPSPGSTVNVAYTGTAGTDATALQNALNAVTCGQTITLPAGSTYTGVFNVAAPVCDGSHWITIRSTGTTDGNFPAEHTQATPALAGIWNDATHGYNAPGYPTYTAANYPTVLTAKIQTGTTNQSTLNFLSGANHYRFIGIEITKVPDVKMTSLIALYPCAYVGQGGCSSAQGSQFIIFDRSLIHGQPWNINTMSTDTNSETQSGIAAANSQYIGLINSWDYDTYCNSQCTDSQAYNGGTGAVQDGPHKIFGNVLASAGETIMLGGGGIGPLTTTPVSVDVRGNLMLKPLAWMDPIETCIPITAAPITKNLFELKNATNVLLEGNAFSGVWQGCQSDQNGYALDIDPKSQNNKATVTVTFDGTDGVVTATSGSFTHLCGSGQYCNPCGGSGATSAAAQAAACVPASCPPGGCILKINDSNRGDDTTPYRFCDGVNGCDQSGMNLDTTARITAYANSYPASGSAGTYACVPGLCPSCTVHDMTARYNKIFNTTNGVDIGTGVASNCNDQSAGAYNFAMHDMDFIALSDEMDNGQGPYEFSAAFVAGNGQLGTGNQIVSNIEIAHNTVVIDETYPPGSSNAGFGGLGWQLDNTDVAYLNGFNIHDNVSPASWHALHSTGSFIGQGVGGSSGLANTYQTDSCQPYYPNDSGGDILNGFAVRAVTAGTAFTFSPALGAYGTGYFVTKNGQNTAVTSTTTTGFTLTAALAQDDSFTVRDLTHCNFTFAGNILGQGLTPAADGTSEAPFPAGTTLLTGTAFTNIFTTWSSRSGGVYALTSGSGLRGAATDASARTAKSQSTDPGADQTLVGTLTSSPSSWLSSIFYYPLTISSTSLPTATHSTSYQQDLTTPAYGVTGGGASPFKSWWVTSTVGSSGLIIGRDGTVGGPFYVLSVSRTSGVATFKTKLALDPLTVPQVNQWIFLTGFVNNGTCPALQCNDASFNGSCQITNVATNGTVSCNQAGATVTAHAPHQQDGSDITFAPITPGSYSFGVGAKDGAFQTAAATVSVTVN